MKSHQLTAHLHAAVVAVAGLGVEVEDDAVAEALPAGADLAVRVLSLTTLPGCPTASQEANRGSGVTSQHQTIVIFVIFRNRNRNIVLDSSLYEELVG